MFQKKSLGQNFLKNKSVVVAMADEASLSPADTVLEAGPGEGVLTEELLKRAGKVIAVEKDDRLIPILEQKFASEISSGKLALIHSDILEFNPSAYGLEPRAYSMVANIPYYITGAFIRKFLSCDSPPTDMIILIQKEVAERIAGKGAASAKSFGEPMKESLLSISVKAYGEPKYVQTVKAGNFEPMPNVDSAVLAIHNISKQFFADFSEEKFFKIVKTAFAHKRKRLAGNLKTLYPDIESVLEKIGLSKNSRAEEISLDKWKKIMLENNLKN